MFQSEPTVEVELTREELILNLYLVFLNEFSILYNPNKVLLIFSKFREILENVSIFRVSIFGRERYSNAEEFI